MDRNESIRPQQKVCETNRDVPTILVEPFHEGGDPEIFVQWFGESSAGMNLDKMQFRFPVPARVDLPHWMGHPELCKVIMLGQIKDWPELYSPRTAQSVADEVSHGDLDAWILWVVAAHYSVKTTSGEGPSCFIIPMTIFLADGVCGVITPRPYCEPCVLERENKIVYHRQMLERLTAAR